MRRERATRRRLRMGAAVTIWVLLGALLTILGARAFTASQLIHLVAQPGFWLPLGLLAFMVCALLFVRRSYGRLHIELSGEFLRMAPGWLRRVTSGRSGATVSLSEVRRVSALALREGTFLVARAPEGEPIAVPLAHPAAAQVATALSCGTPQASWTTDALVWATHVAEGPGREGAPGPVERVTVQGGTFPSPLGRRSRPSLPPAARSPRGFLPRTPSCEGFVEPPPERMLERLTSAGLWHLAAPAAWSAVLSRPDEARWAQTLWALERHRLPTHPRLRLAMNLAKLHPDHVGYRVEVARLALVMRLRPLAQEVLDELVSRSDAPPVIAHWRTCLRERRALPAPPSRATFGIEVNLPNHRLEGDTLVVQDRFRVELRWFVAYILVPGFWGPPRAFELVDLHGGRHLLRGDAVTWAADLSHAAPHLGEVHDVGWLWPPVRQRLAALERTARGRKER